jgi:sugar lactone lactonase YvrE
MKTKIIYYLILSGICIGSMFLIFSGCTNPDENIVYSSDNPDPYPANFNVAVLDSIQPISDYPTNMIAIIGSGFDTRKPEYNFVWFDVARAKVIDIWAESLHVEVPLPNPLQPDYFFDDSIEVKVALQNSYNWSNTIPFIYKPMAHPYLVKVYPSNHTEDKFTKPRGLAFDHQGNMYLSNARLRSIYKDTPIGGERTVYAFSSNLKVDGGMRMGIDGYVYAAGNTENLIYRIPPGGNSFENWVSVPSPWGMDFDDAGNLFVVDNMNGDLYKVSTDGTVKKVIELPGTGEKSYCRVYEGFVYVNDKATGNFFRVPALADKVDSVETIVVSPGNLVNDITFGVDGSMYITASQGGRSSLVKVTLSGEEQPIVELAGELGFLTWYDKFIYISSLTGPVYKVLIYDNTSAPYHGRT